MGLHLMLGRLGWRAMRKPMWAGAQRTFATQGSTSGGFAQTLYRHRYTIAYTGSLGGILLALQLDIHRKLRFASVPHVLSVSMWGSQAFQEWGALGLFRLSRDYQTCLVLEEHGAIEQLGEKIDRQLAMAEREEKTGDPTIILYDLACLSNLARCPGHKSKMVSQDWLRRYSKIANYFQELHRVDPVRVQTSPSLLAFQILISTLSTYSSMS